MLRAVIVICLRDTVGWSAMCDLALPAHTHFLFSQVVIGSEA